MMPAAVEFTVHHSFSQSSRTVWDEMIDWKGHEKWIPLTTVDLGPEPQDQVGSTFTAFTGVWKIGLEDRMRVTQIDWNEETSTGTCWVEKLGPILLGRAGFTVRPDESGTGSSVEWIEDVQAKYLPGFVAPIAGKVGAIGFQQGMKSLAKVLDRACPGRTNGVRHRSSDGHADRRMSRISGS